MQNKSVLILGILVTGFLLLYTVTFTVRTNEAVVVTTFGKADAGGAYGGDGKGEGLHFKWPWPIQDVRRFDTRIQTHEAQLEQVQTADAKQVVVGVYVAWRIKEPLAFIEKVGTTKKGDEQLDARLRDAKSELSRFRFDELTHPDPAQNRLEAAEQAMLDRLRKDVQEQGYGIEIDSVGVRRLILPDPKPVFEQMRNTRQKIAQQARSEGQAQASDIRTRAQTGESIILAFAERRAAAIRAEGEAEAAKYYDTFRQNEDLAIFLRQIETLRETLKQNSTFVLDARTEPIGMLVPPKAENKEGSDKK